MVRFGVLLGYGWDVLALDLRMSFGFGVRSLACLPVIPFSFTSFLMRVMPLSLVISFGNLIATILHRFRGDLVGF